MSNTTVSLSGNVATPTTPLSLVNLEQQIARSTTLAWCLIAGLPLLGITAPLFAGLPLFATMMTGSFLLAIALMGHRAMATFTGKALRLLVTARLMIVLVLGAVFFCTSGITWTAVVSAVVLWLTADRLLGRRALHDLWKLSRQGS